MYSNNPFLPRFKISFYTDKRVVFILLALPGINISENSVWIFYKKMFQSWQNLRIISANSAESIIHAVLDSVLIMVLISNGNSGIDALIRINLCLRHLIRSRAVTTSWLSEKTYLPSCVRNMFRVANYYIIALD